VRGIGLSVPLAARIHAKPPFAARRYLPDVARIKLLLKAAAAAFAALLYVWYAAVRLAPRARRRRRAKHGR
jgi:hypothetical protein